MDRKCLNWCREKNLYKIKSLKDTIFSLNIQVTIVIFVQNLGKTEVAGKGPPVKKIVERSNIFFR